ncbi:hypothetical protein [Nocardioides sp. zg-DK7169]|uniref:hypothetical protein n=1 Tax=Nocardioides sp. zg-DK7169 TaxID=2736600 RepID=UPI0015557947|nr:hypothetical protein [Nocardioides sp. zg-DK7169]NPC95390.1 hypothetical protein [Nocardioides sp. zg-DK7169]
MSSTPFTHTDLRSARGADGPPRRVREQARDVVALMAFSATVSVGVALALLVLSRLG